METKQAKVSVVQEPTPTKAKARKNGIQGNGRREQGKRINTHAF